MGRHSAGLSKASSQVRQQHELIAPFQKKLRSLLDTAAALKAEKAQLLEVLKVMTPHAYINADTHAHAYINADTHAREVITPLDTTACISIPQHVCSRS